MATSADFEESMRAFLKNMRPNTKTPSERAEHAKDNQILKDNSSALKFLKDTLSKNNSLLSDMTNVAKAQNKVLDEAVNSVSDLKSLEKLPGKFRKSLNDSGSAFAKAMAANVTSLEDVFATQGKLETLPQIQSLVHSFVEGENSMSQVTTELEKLGLATNEIQAVMGRFENSVTDANGFIVQNSKARKIAQKTLDSFDKEVNKAHDSIRKFGVAVKNQHVHAKKFLGVIGAAALALGKELYTATKASMKFGAELSLVQSRMAGMSPEEYAQLQGENRQAINALTGGFNEFNSIISNTNMSLVKLTGDLGDATRLTASMISTSRKLGDAGIQTDMFVRSQSKIFKQFHDELSMTAEQFAAMNARLIEDVNVRATLFKMNQKDRAAHFEGIQQSIKLYQTWGLLQPQAEALAKTMEQMAGTGAKERLKQGARLRAVMGAMGMGAQGAEAQRIMLKGARATPQEQQQLATLLKGVEGVISTRMQSFQGEIQTQAMLDRAGLNQLLGPQGDLAKTVLSVGMEQKKANEQNPLVKQFGEGTTGIMATMVGQTDRILSFLSSGFIGALVGGLSFSNIGKSLVGLIRGAGSKLLGLGQAGAEAIASTGARTMAVSAGSQIVARAGPVLAAGAVGYAMGTGINKAIEKWAPSFHEGLVDVVGGSLSKAYDETIQVLIDKIDDLTSAVDKGNNVASEHLKQAAKTQTSIDNQTTSQNANAEKDREQNKTKLAQMAMRSRGRRGGSR